MSCIVASFSLAFQHCSCISSQNFCTSDFLSLFFLFLFSCFPKKKKRFLLNFFLVFILVVKSTFTPDSHLSSLSSSSLFFFLNILDYSVLLCLVSSLKHYSVLYCKPISSLLRLTNPVRKGRRRPRARIQENIPGSLIHTYFFSLSLS